MMSGFSDVEMRDAHQQTSDDSEMRDAHQQTTDDFEMIEATTESFSNDTSWELENQSSKECIKESGGTDSSMGSLGKPQLAPAKVRDNFAKERVEELQSTPVQYKDMSEEASKEKPLLSPAKSGDKSTKENTKELQSTLIGGGNGFAKECMEKPQLLGEKGENKEEERIRGQASSLVNGEYMSTKETIDELRSASAKERDISAKEGLKEPQLAPVEDDNSQGSMEPVMDSHKSSKESVEIPQSVEVKGRDEFPRENSEEMQFAAMKLEDEASSDSLAKSEPEIMSLEDMLKQMINNPMDFERDKEDQFEKILLEIERKKNSNMINSQEQTMATWNKAVEKRNCEQHVKCCHMDVPCRESAERIKTEGLTPYTVTDKPCQQAIDKGGNLDSPGKRSMDENEKKRNQSQNDNRTLHTFPNGEVETWNPHRNAVNNRGNGNSQPFNHLDDPRKHTMDESKKDKPCQQAIDKGGNLDSPGKRSMDESEKIRNQSQNDNRTRHTFPNGEVETWNPHRNAVNNRRDGNFQPFNHLDDPRKHTMDESKKETNQPYANKANSSRQTLLQREKERKSPCKIKEINHPSPVKEFFSRGSNYSKGQYHYSQDTGHCKTDKYKGCNAFAYNGDSFNRMSPDLRSRSRDTNIGNDNRGNVQNWGSAHNHYPSNGQHSMSGEDSPYSDVLNPSQITCILLEYPDFCASLLELLERKGLQPATVRKTVSVHSEVFQLVGETVEFRPKLAFCNAHISKDGCQNEDSCCEMHLCPVYVRSWCYNENCVLGHKWFTRHNKRVWGSLYMQDFPAQALRKIAKLITNTAGPLGQLEICKAYNESKCSNRNCDDIHICHSFVAGRCKCSRSGCRLNHDILSSECIELLKHHGFSTNEAPRDVVMALLSANSSIAHAPADKPLGNSANGYSSDKRSGNSLRSTLTSQVTTKGNSTDDHSSRQGKSSKVVWSHHFQGDSILAEICFYSVEGKCRNENSGCIRLHSSMHYHWQVSKLGANWFNLCLHQVTGLEHAFCDPAQDGILLPQVDPSKLSPNLKGLLNVLGRETWRANFEAMIMTNSDYSKILYIRRLCTERIIGKTLQPNTYVWYFLDKNNKWVKYGNVDSAGEKKLISSVTSAEIEGHFMKSPSLPLIFQNAAYTYSLDLVKMTQRNQQTKVIRRVRRRPEPHMKVVKK